MTEPTWTSKEILFALSDEYGPDGVDIHAALMDHLRPLRAAATPAPAEPAEVSWRDCPGCVQRWEGDHACQGPNEGDERRD